MQYKIIQADSHHELQSIVEQLISKGWIPQGGVAITRGNITDDFYQALVRKEQFSEIQQSNNQRYSNRIRGLDK